MSIETSSTSGTTSATQQPPGATGSSKLGKDEFLKILTTQLANQDPTAPMDDGAFVAQLAQFSTLEQMQNSNDTLTQLLTLQKSSGQTDLVSMVGKDAVYDANVMDLSQGGAISVNTTLAKPATNVVMEVDDADGNVIRNQSFGALPAGTKTLTWDGRNNSGVVQQPGTYVIRVSATAIDGQAVPVTQESRGRITGVTFHDDGNTELMLGNTPILLSEVKSIEEPSTTP